MCLLLLLMASYLQDGIIWSAHDWLLAKVASKAIRENSHFSCSLPDSFFPITCVLFSPLSFSIVSFSLLWHASLSVWALPYMSSTVNFHLLHCDLWDIFLIYQLLFLPFVNNLLLPCDRLICELSPLSCFLSYNTSTQTLAAPLLKVKKHPSKSLLEILCWGTVLTFR